MSWRNNVVYEENFTCLQVDKEWYKSDPFILASQARQVFYMDDPLKSTTNIRWLIVEKFNHRHLWDISNDNEDENIDGNEDLSYHMKTHLIATYVLKSLTWKYCL